jgi:hypothetical protein
VFPYNELFLLQPRPTELAAILSSLDGNDFSSIHTTTQQLFAEGVKALQSGDESKLDNVLVVRTRLYEVNTKDDANIPKCAVRKKIS